MKNNKITSMAVTLCLLLSASCMQAMSPADQDRAVAEIMRSELKEGHEMSEAEAVAFITKMNAEIESDALKAKALRKAFRSSGLSPAEQEFRAREAASLARGKAAIEAGRKVEYYGAPVEGHREPMRGFGFAAGFDASTELGRVFDEIEKGKFLKVRQLVNGNPALVDMQYEGFSPLMFAQSRAIAAREAALQLRENLAALKAGGHVDQKAIDDAKIAYDEARLANNVAMGIFTYLNRLSVHPLRSIADRSRAPLSEEQREQFSQKRMAAIDREIEKQKKRWKNKKENAEYSDDLAVHLPPVALERGDEDEE